MRSHAGAWEREISAWEREKTLTGAPVQHPLTGASIQEPLTGASVQEPLARALVRATHCIAYRAPVIIFRSLFTVHRSLLAFPARLRAAGVQMANCCGKGVGCIGVEWFPQSEQILDHLGHLLFARLAVPNNGLFNLQRAVFENRQPGVYPGQDGCAPGLAEL